jgi:hypothetical protein
LVVKGIEFMNNSFLALPVGRVGGGYSKKLFINSDKLSEKLFELTP